MNKVNLEEANEKLASAARVGDFTRAKEAIKAGANSHLTGDCAVYSNNVVTHAAESGNAELVEYLLRKGAAQQRFDDAAIVVAARNENETMLKAILKYWRFEEYVYNNILDEALTKKNEAIGKLVLKRCSKEKQGEFRAFTNKKSQERRSKAKMSEAEHVLQAAPSHPRVWRIQVDGIIVDVSWNDVLGPGLRELNAKWIRPGWRLSLKHAASFLALLNDYPQLKAEQDSLKKQEQDVLNSALAGLSTVPVPTGYRVYGWNGNIEIVGAGNAELDARLDTSFMKRERTQQSRERKWRVPPQETPLLVGIFQQHPPQPPVTTNQAAIVLRNTRMPPGYSHEISGTAILLKGPYLEELVNQFKSLGGTWDSIERRWHVSLEKAEKLSKILNRLAPSQECIEQAKTILAGIKLPTGYGLEIRDGGIFVSRETTDLDPAFKQLGARWDDPSQSMRLPPEQAQSLATLVQTLPEFSSQAKEILGTTAMPNGYSCEVTEYRIIVRGPKSKRLRKAFLTLGGLWDSQEGWTFRLPKARALATILKNY